MNVPGEPEASQWVLHDFRDALYYPLVSFLSGGNPYDAASYFDQFPVLQPFPPYSPLTFVVHLPFGLFSHHTSQLLFYGYSLILTLALAGFALWVCGREPSVASTCLLSAAILISRPGYMNQLLGQTASELVLGVYVALCFAGSRPWISGFGLVAASLKLTFGLPLAVLLFTQRFYRSVVVGVSMAVLLSALPVGMLVKAAGGVSNFATSVWGAYSGLDVETVSSSAWSPVRVDAITVVGHLVQAEIGFPLIIATFAAVMLTASVALRRVRRLYRGRESDLFCISLSSVAILVAIYHQAYGCLLLVIPLTALALGEWIPVEMKCPSGVRWLLFGLLLVPAVNYGASQYAATQLQIGSFLWLVAGIANGVALSAAFVVLASLPFVLPLSRSSDDMRSALDR